MRLAATPTTNWPSQGPARSLRVLRVSFWISSGTRFLALRLEYPTTTAGRCVDNAPAAVRHARTGRQQQAERTIDHVYWATDDGSGEFHGNVVELMRWWVAKNGAMPQAAHVIGPIPMMRAAAELTREWGVKTFASVNPIMADGTGMCGGCRLTVGGKVVFACVDGPEFDAHQVDFTELIRRNRAYTAQEKLVLEKHMCRVGL
jgi:ferredoxin/flavodoxin---NADP+ reductase